MLGQSKMKVKPHNQKEIREKRLEMRDEKIV